jgi:hypothetical protein
VPCRVHTKVPRKAAVWENSAAPGKVSVSAALLRLTAEACYVAVGDILYFGSSCFSPKWGGSRRAGRMRIAYGSIIAGTMGWVGNHTWSCGKNRSIVPRGAQTGNGRAARPPSSIFSSLALIVSSATERMRCGVFSPARPSRRVMSSAPD